jgi:hypothetical protein
VTSGEETTGVRTERGLNEEQDWLARCRLGREREIPQGS